jgi:hypothetical protein
MNNLNTFQGWQSMMKKLKDGRIFMSTIEFDTNLIDLREKTNRVPDSYHNSIIFYFHQLDEFYLLSCSFDMNVVKWDLRKNGIPLNTENCHTFTYIFEE